MIKNDRRFKIKIAFTIAFLAFALYLVISAMDFFKSPQSTEFLRIFGGAKVPTPPWKWCPDNPRISFKHNKFSNLTDADLVFLCSVHLEQTSTEDAKLVGTAPVLLRVQGSDSSSQKEVLGTADYTVFAIDGLPFKNAEWTKFFQSQDAASSP